MSPRPKLSTARGLESARSMGAGHLELRCVLALARIEGRGEERADLRRILDGLTAGLDQADCRQALAFLETPASGEMGKGLGVV